MTLENDAQLEPLPIPEGGYQFIPPMWVNHLSGGLALLVSANHLAMLMSTGGVHLLPFSVLNIEKCGDVFDAQPPLRILGRTRYESSQKITDAIPDNFSISAYSNLDNCIAENQIRHWSGVGTALHQDKKDPEALIAKRVGLQISFCLNRVHRLSAAYRTVLLSVGEEAVSTEASLKVTTNKYSTFIGGEFRACLNELYSLRDAIMALAFRVKFGQIEPFQLKKLKPLVLNQTEPSSRLIADGMFAKGNGLIEHMSLYRNIALHSLGATNPIFDDIYQLRESSGSYGILPYLAFPLYDDMPGLLSIKNAASKGILKTPTRQDGERFLSRSLSCRDGLEFSYDCFVSLLNIAEALSVEIAIKPQPIKITEKDIIEATFTDAEGVVSRMKRDPNTGRLIKF